MTLFQLLRSLGPLLLVARTRITFQDLWSKALEKTSAAAIIGCVTSVMTVLSSLISRDSGIDVTSPSDTSLRDQQLPVDQITPGISMENSHPVTHIVDAKTGHQKIISVPPSETNKRMGLRDVMEKEVVRAYLLSQCLEKGFRPSGCDVAYSIKKENSDTVHSILKDSTKFKRSTMYYIVRCL